MSFSVMNIKLEQEASSPVVEIPRNANFSYWLESLRAESSPLAMQRAILHLNNPQVYPKVNIGPRVTLPITNDKNVTSESSSQAASTSSDLPCYPGGIRIPSQEIKRMKIPEKSSFAISFSARPVLRKVVRELSVDRSLPALRTNSSDKSSKKCSKDDSKKKKDKSKKEASSASKSRRESKSKDKSYSKSHFNSSKSQFSKPSNDLSSVMESNVTNTVLSSDESLLKTPASTSSEDIESLEDRLARVVGQVSQSQLIPEPLVDLPPQLLARERRYSGDSTDSRKRKKDSQNKEKKEKRKKDVHTSELFSEDRILLRISRDVIRDYSAVVTTPPPKDPNNFTGQQPEEESSLRRNGVVTEKETSCEPAENSGTTVAQVISEDETTCLSNTTHENMDLDDDVATEPNSEVEECDFCGIMKPVFTHTDFREVEIKQEKVASSFVEIATQTEIEPMVKIFAVPLPNNEPATPWNQPASQVENSKKVNVECQTEERSDEKDGEDELMTLEKDLLMTRMGEMEQKAREHLVSVLKDLKEQEKLQAELKSKQEICKVAKKRLQTFQGERDAVLAKERECEQSVTEVNKKVESTKQEMAAWNRKELELKIATTNAELAILCFKRDRGIESNYRNDPEYLGLLSKQNVLKEERDNYDARRKELEEQLTTQEGALAVAEDLYHAHHSERGRVDKELSELVGNSENAQKDCDELQAQIQKLSHAITNKQLEALTLKQRVLKMQFCLKETSPLGTVIMPLPLVPQQAPPLNEKDPGVSVISGISAPTASLDSSHGKNRVQTPVELPEKLIHEYMHCLFLVHIALYEDTSVPAGRQKLLENCLTFSDVAIKMSDAFPSYSTKTGYAKIKGLFCELVRRTPSLCLQCSRNVSGLPSYERVEVIFNVARKVRENGSQSLSGVADSQTSSVVQLLDPNESQGEQTGSGRLQTIRVKPLSHLYETTPPPLTPQEATQNPGSNERTANVVSVVGTQSSVPVNQQRVLVTPVIPQVRIPPPTFSSNGATATSQGFEQRLQAPMHPAIAYSSQKGQQHLGPNTVVRVQAVNGQSVSSYGSSVPNRTGPRVSSYMRMSMVNNRVQYGNMGPLVGNQGLCILCKKPADRNCLMCNAVQYCSISCQITDRSRHVTVCQSPVNYVVANRMPGT